jgi:hypothetical protein
MHHSSQPDPEMMRRFVEAFDPERQQLRDMERKLGAMRTSEFTPKLGATGRFPEGQLTDSDEGEIQFRVGVIERKVVIDFGQEVVWVGMNAEQARGLARMLLKHAEHAS